MYIGPPSNDGTLLTNLIRFAVGMVADDAPAPASVQLQQFGDGVFRVAFNGEPLPVGLLARRPTDVPHPELYEYFLRVFVPSHRALSGGVVLNALTARLIVSTSVGGHRYDTTFARGALLTLMSKTPCADADGINSLTFRHDSSVVSGAFTADDGRRIAANATTPAVSVTFEDNSSEYPVGMY